MIRGYLAEHLSLGLGRVVLIAIPNAGTPLVDKYRDGSVRLIGLEASLVRSVASTGAKSLPLFQYSPEVIRVTVLLYVRYPLLLRQVEDLLFERGIDICHETVRFLRNRFASLFAAEIRKRRVQHRYNSPWRWHLDEVFVKINGEMFYLWRAVDHEGEVLEVFVTKRQDRKVALAFLKRAMRRYGRPEAIVTDRLRSYRSAMKVLGNSDRQECGRWLNNRAENSHQPFRRREGAKANFRDIKTL